MSGQSGSGHGLDLDRRRAFMRLDASARARLTGIRPLVEQALPDVLARFYEDLGRFEEMAALFDGAAHMNSAKQRQLGHWGSILAGSDDAVYERNARTVGETHARIGLTPSWYIGGYAMVLEDLVRQVLTRSWPRFGGGREARDRTIEGVASLIKSALLDLDLVLTVYNEASERDRQQADAERTRVQTEQRGVVQALGQALSKLADGDLTYRLNDSFPGDYEGLRNDFNEASARLEEAMGVIDSNVGAIRSGAAEIAQAADDLSRRTEQQAASLEETAAALDEITATVKGTTDGALRADDAAGEAKADAQASGEVVRNAVHAMGEIESSAKQISQIIGVIDEIAFQTNLLALNAGVEAARAGESGRGFAVVASEVRALAQRSAEAAKEIKGLISASSTQVSAGVQLVGQTGEALTRMVDRVSEISSLVADIAHSAKEQSTGLTQVNLAINEMDQVTQRNAAMVEQSTAASHALAQEAEQLAQSVSRFRIAAAAPARRPAAPARPAPMMRRTGRAGGALPKPAAEPQSDGWEEF